MREHGTKLVAHEMSAEPRRSAAHPHPDGSQSGAPRTTRDAPHATRAPRAPSRRALYALLAVVVLVWGANWPIMKIGLREIPPFRFAALRMALGAATLLTIQLARGALRPPPRGDWPVVASVGLLHMAITVALVNLGLRHLGAGRSAVLAFTTPLWVVPGAALLLGERIDARRAAGLVLGLGGMAVLFRPSEVDWSSTAALRGNALLMASAFTWALAILHVRGHRWHATPLDLAPWQMSLAAAVLGVLAAVLEPAAPWRVSPTALAVLAYNGLAATGFAFWAVVTINRGLPASETSVVLLAVPAVGILSAALAIGERPSVGLLAGLAGISAGVALTATAPVGARGYSSPDPSSASEGGGATPLSRGPSA